MVKRRTPGLLISQIRDSDFLAQNPARGPSLFELAQLQPDQEAPALEMPGEGTGAQHGGTAAGLDESVEDLATMLMRQVSSRLSRPQKFTAHIVYLEDRAWFGWPPNSVRTTQTDRHLDRVGGREGGRGTETGRQAEGRSGARGRLEGHRRQVAEGGLKRGG